MQYGKEGDGGFELELRGFNSQRLAHATLENVFAPSDPLPLAMVPPGLN